MPPLYFVIPYREFFIKLPLFFYTQILSLQELPLFLEYYREFCMKLPSFFIPQILSLHDLLV